MFDRKYTKVYYGKIVWLYKLSIKNYMENLHLRFSYSMKHQIIGKRYLQDMPVLTWNPLVLIRHFQSFYNNFPCR